VTQSLQDDATRQREMRVLDEGTIVTASESAETTIDGRAVHIVSRSLNGWKNCDAFLEPVCKLPGRYRVAGRSQHHSSGFGMLCRSDRPCRGIRGGSEVQQEVRVGIG